MALTRETELKLELTPEAADALVASGLISGEPEILDQHAIYFDTPDRDLDTAGFSLRIRQAGGRRIQTVKATGSGAAGLFVRPEWERAVEGDEPVLDETTPVRTLLGAKAQDIGPAFEVRVERRVWNVVENEARIELVLDRGEIVAGDRHTPVCEIELELKEGASAALFALARRIDAVAPLRAGVLSKAERGYRLLGPALRAVKAEPVILDAGLNAADAFRHIAGACLRQFRLNEARLDRRHDEALHQARVALRRLRTALTVHKPMLEDAAFPRLREDLRWLAATLGEARDLDVLVARSGGEEIRARLEEARGQAYDRAEAALASPRARSLMLDLSEWLAIGEWSSDPAGKELREQPARRFAASALDRFRRKVKKKGRDLAGLDDPSRHELRKDAKKLRYATDFFASLFKGKREERRRRRFLDTLETLQDQLGALNDLAAAHEVLSRLGLDGDPAAEPLLKSGRKKKGLIEDAAEAHDAFADAKRFWR